MSVRFFCIELAYRTDHGLMIILIDFIRNEPLIVLASFAGVALAAKYVHGDRQRFVSFG